MKFIKILPVAFIVFLITQASITLAQETQVIFTPTTQGSNSGEEVSPMTQGSNANEAAGIIPNTQGSNDNEGSASIIPNAQGSNGDETVIQVPATTPVVEGSNNQERSSSSSSSGGSTITPPPVAPANPSLTDTDDCIYINDYLTIKGPNNPTEVTKLQEFLNKYEGFSLKVTGIFDQTTFNAVKTFQTKYLGETMTPWGWKVGSGIVSYTTKKKINEIYCRSNFSLTPEQLATIQAYKKRLLTPPKPSVVRPLVSEPTTTPVIEEEPTSTPEVEVGFNTPTNIEAPMKQTASVADAQPGFFQGILNALKDLF